MSRPDGWKNPYKEEMEMIVAESKRHNIDSTWVGEVGVGASAYEAGADAMLEGLKKQSNHAKRYYYAKGKWVFLPEERE